MCAFSSVWMLQSPRSWDILLAQSIKSCRNWWRPVVSHSCTRGCICVNLFRIERRLVVSVTVVIIRVVLLLVITVVKVQTWNESQSGGDYSTLYYNYFHSKLCRYLCVVVTNDNRISVLRPTRVSQYSWLYTRGLITGNCKGSPASVQQGVRRGQSVFKFERVQWNFSR